MGALLKRDWGISNIIADEIRSYKEGVHLWFLLTVIRFGICREIGEGVPDPA